MAAASESQVIPAAIDSILHVAKPQMSVATWPWAVCPDHVELGKVLLPGSQDKRGHPRKRPGRGAGAGMAGPAVASWKNDKETP
jgi:hypothetical protein